MYPSPFKIVTTAGAAVGCLLMSSANVSAATFSFVTNTSVNNAPTGDILLDSVTFGSTTISDFVFVDEVVIVENDPIDDLVENSGAASSDKGDDVVAPGITASGLVDPTPEQIRDNLANNNLNSIVDTEEDGNFTLDLDFGQVIDTLFLWERGGNSSLELQALDVNGTLIGSAVTVDSSTFDSAGFSIDTTQIEGAQEVFSLGIEAPHFFNTTDDIYGVRAISEAVFNGPDFKLIASAPSVPEPATVLGLAAVAGAFCLSRGRGQAKTDA